MTIFATPLTNNQIAQIIFLLLILIFAIYKMTRRSSGKMGINIRRVICPVCGELQPIMRRPKTFKQVLYGGGTCAKCGEDIDKWGKVEDGG